LVGTPSILRKYNKKNKKNDNYAGADKVVCPCMLSGIPAKIGNLN
jgi:hypothetical protein